MIEIKFWCHAEDTNSKAEYLNFNCPKIRTLRELPFLKNSILLLYQLELRKTASGFFAPMHLKISLRKAQHLPHPNETVLESQQLPEQSEPNRTRESVDCSQIPTSKNHSLVTSPMPHPALLPRIRSACYLSEGSYFPSWSHNWEWDLRCQLGTIQLCCLLDLTDLRNREPVPHSYPDYKSFRLLYVACCHKCSETYWCLLEEPEKIVSENKTFLQFHQGDSQNFS